MYEYELIIMMSNGREFKYDMGQTENQLSEEQKKQMTNAMISHDYINLYEHGEYVSLHTNQIAYFRFREHIPFKLPK